MADNNYYGTDQDDKPRNRMFAGLVLLAVGALLLLRQIGFFFPDWIFSWPMILIAVGIFIGARHEFRNPAWVIMVGIGAFFLLDQEFMNLSLRRFIAPIIIGAVGLMLILNPNRKRRRWDRDRLESLGERIERDVQEAVRRNYKYQGPLGSGPAPGSATGTADTGKTDTGQGAGYTSSGFRKEGPSSDEYVNEVAVLSGVNRQFFSKDFKGGRVTAVLGGTELNFINADIKGTVSIEMNNVFGGTKLVIPSSWTVRHNISSIFGGIEDKRQVIPGSGGSDPEKVLYLHGACIFGGLEIRNF